MPDKVIEGGGGSTTIARQLRAKVELGQLIVVPVGQSGEPFQATVVIRAIDMMTSSMKHSMIDFMDVVQDRTLHNSEPGAMTPDSLNI